ncbi:MAG: hypothetical protein J4224_01710 [Candidatus Diapherotrites archaeon]|uniref:Uncharacterized protein n=1 Tax=Candidatus Iainarchaeum sp. TaxID=3101447 RepID=A0A8T4KXK1_9ARCH|nr:hypothetical protein [Candidatus Diapherotrites archaeon]
MNIELRFASSKQQYTVQKYWLFAIVAKDIKKLPKIMSFAKKIAFCNQQINAQKSKLFAVGKKVCVAFGCKRRELRMGVEPISSAYSNQKLQKTAFFCFLLLSFVNFSFLKKSFCRRMHGRSATPAKR